MKDSFSFFFFFNKEPVQRTPFVSFRCFLNGQHNLYTCSCCFGQNPSAKKWKCVVHCVTCIHINMAFIIISSCHFSAIHNSSPVASWDCKVSTGCTFQNLTWSSRSSGNILPTVLWTLWIEAYYSLQILVFTCYIVGLYAISDAAMVMHSKQDRCYYC